MRTNHSVIRRSPRAALAGILSLVALAPASAAQDPPSALPAWTTHNLRFEDKPAQPGVDTTHWYDGMRGIPLAGEDGEADWLLTVGGELRYRYQRETNKPPGPLAPRVNDFHLLRTRLFTDFRHREGYRIFVELLSAKIHGNERPPTPIDRNSLDVQNAFFEVTRGEDRFKVGRSEMQYGRQRLVSPLEWGNTRRTFEGAWWRNTSGNRTVDLFVTRPIVVKPHGADSRDNSRWFGGAYATWTGLSGNGTGDLYFLVLDENDEIVPSFSPPSLGDMTIFTVGARRDAKWGNVDGEVELAQQFGNRAGDDVNAQMVALAAGITQPEWAGKPRFGIGLDYASGDDNPTDSSVGTFNQLFPLGHAYFGYIDLVGRQNIIDLHADATWTLDNGAKARVAYHNFNLADSHDALYGAGSGGGVAPGIILPASATGAFGRDVGDEIDFTFEHSPAFLRPHGSLLLGYSVFFPGRFYSLQRTSAHIHLLYAQLIFKF